MAEGVGVATGVSEGVADGSGLTLGSELGLGVSDGVGLGSTEGSGVSEGTGVSEATGVSVGVGVGVAETTGVSDGVGVGATETTGLAEGLGEFNAPSSDNPGSGLSILGLSDDAEFTVSIIHQLNFTICDEVAFRQTRKPCGRITFSTNVSCACVSQTPRAIGVSGVTKILVVVET